MKRNMTVLKYIRRCSLKKIWYPFFVLVLVIILTFFLPIYGQLAPIDISSDTANGRRTPDDLYQSGDVYVKKRMDAIYYTGCDYYSNGQLKGHYYYHLDESHNRLYFYVLPVYMGRSAQEEISSFTMVGRLMPMGSAHSTLSRQLAQSLNWSTEDVASMSDAYMVSRVDYFTWYHIVLYILMFITFLICFTQTIRHLLIIIFPKTAPAYRRLYHYGKASEIMSEVDRELKEECIVLTKDMALLSDYLIEFSEDISVIVPLKSILWVYEHATLRQSSSFRPLSYTLHIVMEDGDSFVFNNKLKEDIDIILEELSLRYPNFFYGYSDEHFKMVKHIVEENKEENKKIVFNNKRSRS